MYPSILQLCVNQQTQHHGMKPLVGYQANHRRDSVCQRPMQVYMHAETQQALDCSFASTKSTNIMVIQHVQLQ